MHEIRVDISIEITEWLRKLRSRSRMSINEVSAAAQVEPALLIGWETGFPIPVSDLLVLMRVYGITSVLVGAKITHLHAKYLVD